MLIGLFGIYSMSVSYWFINFQQTEFEWCDFSDTDGESENEKKNEDDAKNKLQVETPALADAFANFSASRRFILDFRPLHYVEIPTPPPKQYLHSHS